MAAVLAAEAPEMGLVELSQALRAVLAGFDPALHAGSDCAAIVKELAATEKACAAAKVRAARRAADCQAHCDQGFRNPADWLAKTMGSSTGQAQRDMDTDESMKDCPQTEAALRNGELSFDQAAEIARTERDCPGSEREMLKVARRKPLRDLREKGREKRQAAMDPDELHDKQRTARSFRSWFDELGLLRFTGALTPDVGVPLLKRIEHEAKRRRDGAKAAGGEVEPWERYAADALAGIVSGEAASGRTEMVIVADLFAYRRGHTEDNEVCHIVGGGPIPVTLAQDLARDAFLKAVLHDGVAIHTVAHFGRHIPAQLRTALELGEPPGFQGATCVDCGRNFHLEIDHVEPVANGGKTSKENLKPRCWYCHVEKTERDREAGLLGSKRGERAPP